MTQYKTITFEVQNHVAEVFLNRPEKSNAMNPDFWPELTEAFKKIHDDKDIRVALVAGNGKNFSAGLDLMASGELMQTGKGTMELDTLYHFILGLQESMNVVDECRKPVVAAIHGACIGGGLDLIAACDIRLAAKGSRFSLREAALGIIADLGSLNRLPHIIGEGHTRELAYTAKDIDADRALRIGLLNDLYEDKEECLKEARKLVAEIAATAPLAVQGAKEVMNYQRDKSIRDGLAYAAARSCLVLKSNDLMEAITAFMQKRKPEFKGE